jgi:DNA polymerase III epsilon subunit-like protein
MRLLVFDTETTNKPPSVALTPHTIEQWPYMVQFSFVLIDTDTYKYTEYDFVIQCKVQIENDFIHGITTSMNKTIGYSFSSIYPIFEECMKQADLLIGHNIEFDINMIRAECFRNHLHWSCSKPFYCTMKSTTRLCALPRLKWPTLKELHSHLFQETPSNLHNSMIDVWACLRCYLKVMHNVDILEKKKKIRHILNPVKDKIEL